MAAPLPPTPIVSMRRGQSVTSQMGGVYSVLKGLGRGQAWPYHGALVESALARTQSNRFDPFPVRCLVAVSWSGLDQSLAAIWPKSQIIDAVR